MTAAESEASCSGCRGAILSVEQLQLRQLINELVEAADDRRLGLSVARYGRFDSTSLGYVQLDARGAELLFQS